MKKMFQFLFIIFISIQVLGHSFWYAYYKINQNSISKNICVKKAEKNNTCNGKCFLKKKFKELDQNESQSQKNNLKIDIISDPLKIDFQAIVSTPQIENSIILPLYFRLIKTHSGYFLINTPPPNKA